MEIKELDVVELTDGRTATVMDIYRGGAEFLVEISDDQGRTLDLPTVRREDIAKVTWHS